MILPRTSEGLYLLQRVRDEAHRFAITHHRGRRSNSMVESLLDDVPGLGEVRRKALVQLLRLAARNCGAATVEEIAEVPGIGPRTALAIKEALRQAPHGRRSTWPPARCWRTEPSRGRIMGPSTTRLCRSGWSSSAACRARVARPPATAWRTLAGTWWTTFRRACCPRCRRQPADRPGRRRAGRAYAVASSSSSRRCSPNSAQSARAGDLVPGGSRRRHRAPSGVRTPAASAAGRRSAAGRHPQGTRDAGRSVPAPTW